MSLPHRPDDGRSTVDRLADAWTAAIDSGSFVSIGRTELRALLGELAGRMVAVVDGYALPGTASEVGSALVAAHLTDPAALRSSLDVLTGHLVVPQAGAPPDGGPARIRRASAALNELSSGYARALQERTRTEQERISAAAFTARGVAEAARWASEARYGAVFEHAVIGISVSDVEGTVLEVNRSLCRMLGYRADELLGRSVFGFIHPDDDPDAWPRIAAMTAGEIDHVRLEKAYFRKDGLPVWTELVVSLIRGPDGAPQYLVAMVEDVTERHELQSRLQYQAEHDPLTGLPNRALFFHRLNRALEAGPDADGEVGVCYLDLDGFKEINDTLGHDAGDRLLHTVATRLHRSLGTEGHTVARMGGDEFVVLVEHCTGVDELVPLARRSLELIRAPLYLEGREIAVSASAGLVTHPRSGQRAERPDGAVELMKAADTTMYWAKRDGRDRFAVFDPGRHDHDVAVFELSGRMPAALDAGEFELDYQPLVRFRDGRVTGVEALARWRPPDGSRFGPDVFIPIAEQTGLIVPLGLYLLRRACRDAAGWPDPDLVLSVNVSGRQLREPDAVERIAAILSETGRAPSSVQLELTESDLMAAEGRPVEALQELSALGVRIAIDDFGTGWSNLAYLHRLPVDVLKLAGSFVTQGSASGAAGRDVDSPVILSAVIDLAHTLGLSAVAESVETAEQAHRLRELGCDVGQGWHLGEPVPAGQVPAMLDLPAPG